jgi:hypothetical protein
VGSTPQETSLSTERMIALMNHFGLGAEYFGGVADRWSTSSVLDVILTI